MKRSSTRTCDSIIWNGEAQKFHRATTRVRAAQERVLRRILRNNGATEYGRRYGFGRIIDSGAYRESVPLADYGAIGGYVERIARGESDILLRGRPLCLQPTSGTTSGSKLIPFTAELREEFRRGVAPWLCDLWTQQPALISGKSYWSISPVIREQRTTSGGVPVGFLDDTGYLPPAMAAVIGKGLAVPGALGLVTDRELFRYLTMAFLLKRHDLVFISIWNPTFFLLLLESLGDNFAAIVEDIEQGGLSCLGKLPEELRGSVAAAFGGADPGRAAGLRAMPLREAAAGTAPFARLWPELRLISCWEDAAAKGPAALLRAQFPEVAIQPKGLIATEAMVSIPFRDAEYPVLSILSHFFEFIPVGSGSETARAWELEPGALYEVVVTTSGGLYRYRLGDIVRVRGFYNDAPMLEFMGRGDHTSDFHGEKLHQVHVTEAIERLFRGRDRAGWFALLAPDGAKEVDHYTLFVAGDALREEARLDQPAERLDSLLRSNFHYDYCRKLGQLKEAEVCRVDGGVTGALAIYMTEMKNRGIREGDIKPALMDNRPVWRRLFGV